MASEQDALLLANGLDYHTHTKWGEHINDTDTFGFTNDGTWFIPLNDENPTLHRTRRQP